MYGTRTPADFPSPSEANKKPAHLAGPKHAGSLVRIAIHLFTFESEFLAERFLD